MITLRLRPHAVPVDPPTRPLRRRSACTALVVLAVVVASLLAGCSADEVSTEGSPMTPNTDVDTGDPSTSARADWDLSVPRTPRDLGSQFDDIVTVETLGRDGVAVDLTLPGGDVVTGAFGFVTGETGRDASIAYVNLASTQLSDGAWDARIDAFVEQFGGDRQAIADYIGAAAAATGRGEVDPGRTFPGDPRPGYTPALQLRPNDGAVVVDWQFTITPAPTS